MWKKINISGLKYDYEVSNTGRVRRLAGTEKKKHANGTTYESKVSATELTPVSNGLGYLQVKLTTTKNLQKSFYVHRLVMETFRPNKDKSLDINHKDSDKSNNNQGNLEWATKSENQTKMAENNPHIVNNLKK